MANQRPTATIRIGTVKAAIWENQAGERTRYNVTFSKRYRDAEGQWKTTPQLRPQRPSAFGQGRRSRPHRHCRSGAGRGHQLPG